MVLWWDSPTPTNANWRFLYCISKWRKSPISVDWCWWNRPQEYSTANVRALYCGSDASRRHLNTLWTVLRPSVFRYTRTPLGWRYSITFSSYWQTVLQSAILSTRHLVSVRWRHGNVLPVSVHGIHPEIFRGVPETDVSCRRHVLDSTAASGYALSPLISRLPSIKSNQSRRDKLFSF